MILFETLTRKAKHRSQVKLLILIHESTIDLLSDNDKSFVEYLSKYKYLTDYDMYDINKYDSVESYKINTRLLMYWLKFLDSLPKVKMDNRVKLGTYKMFDFNAIDINFKPNNLHVIVRSSERMTDQILEVIKI